MPTTVKYQEILNIKIKLVRLNKHFESSQKLLKSSCVDEIFKKYSKVPKELLTIQITKFTKT